MRCISMWVDTDTGEDERIRLSSLTRVSLSSHPAIAVLEPQGVAFEEWPEKGDIVIWCYPGQEKAALMKLVEYGKELMLDKIRHAKDILERIDKDEEEFLNKWARGEIK